MATSSFIDYLTRARLGLGDVMSGSWAESLRKPSSPEDILLSRLMQGYQTTKQATQEVLPKLPGDIAEAGEIARQYLGEVVRGKHISPLYLKEQPPGFNAPQEYLSGLGAGMDIGGLKNIGGKMWYSRLRRAIEETPMKQAPGFKWMGVAEKWHKGHATPTLGKTWREGIPADELKWIDLEPGKRYSKQEVLDRIAENEYRIEDVTLGEYRNEYEKFVARMQEKYGEGYTSDMLSEAERSAAEKYWERTQYPESRRSLEPKFSTYQEPGGTNYREMFVTAPSSRKLTKSESDILWERAVSAWGSEDAVPQWRLNELLTETTPPKWHDGHREYSDIQNPIVRLRTNDRIAPDGKKVLFIEEMQAPLPDEFAKMPEELRKRWREIGMKRAIRLAAEEGYDRVAWTTGEMQAARYDLSKHIDRLHWVRRETGEYKITGTKAGEPLITQDNIPANKLDQYIGKEAAEKITKASGKQYLGEEYGDLSGIDLKVGGEGLKRLYDQDLPAVADKLGKRFGSRSGTSEIELISFNKKVPSIDITPAMRKSVMEKGYPLLGTIPLVPIGTAEAFRRRKEKQ